jgi:hypothetical protein
MGLVLASAIPQYGFLHFGWEERIHIRSPDWQNSFLQKLELC